MDVNAKKKIKLITLFGPSGSGKDTLAKILAKRPDVSEVVTCTTRPKRDYEQDKIDYYFLTNEEFAEKVLNGTMLEATSFRNWFYGTPIEAFKEDKINVGVFNQEGVECLLAEPRLEVIPIYVACEDNIRLLRTLTRETNPDCEEICRRFLADKQDFEVINFDYLTFYNGAKVEPDWINEFLINHGLLSKLD